MSLHSSHISVIIPTYERPEYLIESILSAFDQDLDDSQYDILVVSDGDPTVVESVEKFLWTGDEGVYFDYDLLASNQGMSAAFNHGVLLRMNKEYVTILPDDDKMTPCKLRVLSDYLDNHPEVDMVCSLAKTMSPRGQVLEEPSFDWIREEVKDGVTLHKVLTRNPIHGGTTMYRTSLFKKVGLYDESLIHAEEWDFHLRVLLNGYTIHFVDEVTTYYRVHTGNKSKKKAANRAAGLHKGVRPWKEILIKNYQQLS